MRKKSTYLYFLAAIIILIAAAFALNISVIKTLTHSVLTMAASPWVCAVAAISAFIFTGNKHYWLINAATAVIAAIAIQFFIIDGNLVFMTILARALAFLTIVYLLNLLKILIVK